jgi:hypothetical protein
MRRKALRQFRGNGRKGEFRWKIFQVMRRFFLPSRVRTDLVPLGRPLEAYFDNLSRVCDVIPASVGLPTVGNNLDESAADWRVRNTRNAFAICFDVQFDFLVLPERALLDILHVDAGIFNGHGLVAASHFDRQAAGSRSLRRRLRRKCRWILRSYAEGSCDQECKAETCEFSARKLHVPVDPILHGKPISI